MASIVGYGKSTRLASDLIYIFCLELTPLHLPISNFCNLTLTARIAHFAVLDDLQCRRALLVAEHQVHHFEHMTAPALISIKCSTDASVCITYGPWKYHTNVTR